MSEKNKIIVCKLSLVAVLFVMLLFPLATTSFSNEKVSLPGENRYANLLPELKDEEGNFNQNYFTEFEGWFNDHVGQRELLTNLNGTLQYRLFNVFQPAQNVYSGRDGYLNYFSSHMIPYHQHLNLRSEEELMEIQNSFLKISDWLSARGIQFYYMQCYDKQAIYPEWMPDTIIQYGDESRSGQISRIIGETSIPFVDTKEIMLKAKEEGLQPYSRYGDPTHWTQRGAYLAYRCLMEEINSRNQGIYRVLSESDYDRSISDSGMTYYKWIHFRDPLEQLAVKDPKAFRNDENLPIIQKPNSRLFENPEAGNDTTVLILGDSYIRSFIADDLAESFRQLVFFNFNEVPDFAEAVRTFEPQIVIFEGVERSDHMETVVKFANMLEEE